MINKIELLNFKNVKKFTSELKEINILIGENNSGKSSVLQGIHFSIMAEVVRRKKGTDTVRDSDLLYLPSSELIYLRHNQPYTVTTTTGNTSELKIIVDGDCDNKPEDVAITIRKGRNAGNISLNTSGGSSYFRGLLFQDKILYSMYVPGISGIPVKEALVTKAVLRSAVARGDANMYVRNIIYYLKEDNKLHELNEWIKSVFPKVEIEVPFDPDNDLNILVNMKMSTDEEEIITLPIEQCGTGMLQILQIMAYVLYFEPKLLLLDEPDEHLHPTNQRILAEILKRLADEKKVQIILCTHSRHLLSALGEDAKIIWMKKGSVSSSQANAKEYEILLDIGALDKFDEVIGGRYKCIFLTEDADDSMCNILLSHNGFVDTLVFPFKGCGNIDTALMLASFIHQVSPNCIIVIHRDRDFLLDKEIQEIRERVAAERVIPFITEQSDIEAYFVTAGHLSAVLEISTSDAQRWIEDIIQKNQVDITIDYSNKRNEAKKLKLYTRSNDKEKWVEAKKLLKDACDENGGKIPPTYVKGKFLKKKINGSMYSKWGWSKNILVDSDFLESEELKRIAKLLS